MNDEDYLLYQQAVAIANTGQRHPAYEHFCLIRSHGNEDIALLFWIVATTPHPTEAQIVLDEIALREPNHPSLQNARIDHERKLRQVQPVGLMPPMGPVIQCPVCQSRAPILIKNKVATGGWVLLALLLAPGILFVLVGLLSVGPSLGIGIILGMLSLVGLLIREEYRVCSHCGARLG